MVGNGSVQKICLICKQDCAAKPRVRDNQGRYYCKACIANRKQEQTAGAIPIDTAQPPPMKTCSVCVRPMAPGTVVCMNCGHDTRKGIQTSALVQKSRTKKGKRELKCKACGYDMTGAPSLVCPECGIHLNISRKERMIRGDAKNIVRNAYLYPAICILAGLISSAIAFATMGDIKDFAYYLVVYAVSIPIGMIVFFFCSLAFMGFNAPIQLVALQIAAVFALSDVANILISELPLFFWMSIFLQIWILGLLLAKLCDLDTMDAWIVAIIMFLIRWGAMIGAVVYFDL